MPELSPPLGFRMSAVYCGIKQNDQALDLALIVTDQPAVAAGVYTLNRIVAAPVVLDRERTPSNQFRALVVNSGNANACTGAQGDRDAVAMTEFVAEACDLPAESVLILSTGIIGHLLPMPKVAAGIRQAAGNLQSNADAVDRVARGFMTTDLVRKVVSREIKIGGQSVRLLGIAKGSGMIAPNMATMLAAVLTDAQLTPAQAQTCLQQANAKSFQCITVDGHTSTNDTALLLASGASRQTVDDTSEPAFQAALDEICAELARAIAVDGEGATKLIEVCVSGCQTDEDAVTIAKAVANSPLVKTAVAGADPNWGRIVSAAGFAGVAFDPARIELRMNGTLLFAGGTPQPFDDVAMSDEMSAAHLILMELRLTQPDNQVNLPGSARVWGCDLTADYVRINADYRT